MFFAKSQDYASGKIGGTHLIQGEPERSHVLRGLGGLVAQGESRHFSFFYHEKLSFSVPLYCSMKCDGRVAVGAGGDFFALRGGVFDQYLALEDDTLGETHGSFDFQTIAGNQ